MPQKTKKEKIIAEYRRRLQILQEHRVTVQKSEPTTLSSQSKPVLPEMAMQPKDDSLIVSYFKNDFKKSLYLIAAVIALEILLYFASINNYFKLGR